MKIAHFLGSKSDFFKELKRKVYIYTRIKNIFNHSIKYRFNWNFDPPFLPAH